jgi:poly(3-hydroxybutyrate) depolymerase
MRAHHLRSLFGLLAGLSLVHAALAEQPGPLTADQEELVRQAVWGTGDARAKALSQIRSLDSTSERVRQVEQIIRARRYGPIQEHAQTVSVTVGGRKIDVLVQLPADYDPSRRHPVMIAIGGGPPPNEEAARVRGKYMQKAWSKPAEQVGWIVAAVEDTVSVRLPGKEIRYRMLDADHLRAVRAALLERYAIDPNRLHVTGISLGSNYALAYAAAHPDWIAGIAPVSTEGESREHVVRNLRNVGVYVLEGAKDKNIRTIDGPRKLAEILKNFGYSHCYEEDPDKAHEGFLDKYPQVLKWLAERPRPAFPKEICRLPHAGIVIPGKRFYWLEADTHQAAFTAKVEGNTIDVQAARATRLTFHLSDRLLDLDAPVVIRINGKVVHDKPVPRSLLVAVEDAAALNDSERFATARVTVAVPDLTVGEKWLAGLAPKVEPSTLPYWEHFAMLTLREQRPVFPAELDMVPEPPPLPAGHTALRIKTAADGGPLRAGDLVLRFDGEPFFQGADSIGFLTDYLVRTKGKTVELQISRDGKTQAVTAPLQQQEKQEKARYLRLLPDKAVDECQFTQQRGDKGWSISSVTQRGAMRLIVTARYDAQDMLAVAAATLQKGEEMPAVRVQVAAGKATIKHDGQDPQEFDVPRGTIVTSAPDWTDTFLLCQRYDRGKGGKQEFPALWIHPEKPAQRLTFSIERQGKDTVEHDSKKLELDRHLIRIRNNSEYAAWTDAAGRMIKLTSLPFKDSSTELVLEGYEKSARNLRPPER